MPASTPDPGPHQDEVTPSDVADLVGRTPSAGPVGRIAIAHLDNDARGARWATATAEALADRGIGVLLVDLIEQRTGWQGLSEVAKGGVRLRDVLQPHPYLPIASVGSGLDRDRALGRIDGALRHVPAELGVVIVGVRSRDLRRRRGSRALRSGWFDRVLLVAGTAARLGGYPRIGQTPVEVVVSDVDPPAEQVPPVRPLGAVEALGAGRPATPPAPQQPRTGRAPRAGRGPSSPGEPYRSATVRVLPAGTGTGTDPAAMETDEEAAGATPGSPRERRTARPARRPPQ
jgi:hypothetical protein